MVLVWTVAASALILPHASAGAAVVYWGETKANNVVQQQVHLPCSHVRGTKPSLCDIAFYRSLRDRLLAESSPARCLERYPRPQDVELAASCALTGSARVADAEANIRQLQAGWPIVDAECIGTGLPDRSGYRFSRFRCKIAVEDLSIKPQPSDSLSPLPMGTVRGRIVVFTTGQKSLRWSVIP